MPINLQGAFNGVQPQFIQIPVPHHHHSIAGGKDCAHTVTPQSTVSGDFLQFNNQWQPIPTPTKSSLIAYNPHAALYQKAASLAQLQNHQNHHNHHNQEEHNHNRKNQQFFTLKIFLIVFF